MPNENKKGKVKPSFFCSILLQNTLYVRQKSSLQASPYSLRGWIKMLGSFGNDSTFKRAYTDKVGPVNIK